MPRALAAAPHAARQTFYPAFALASLVEHPQNPNVGDVDRIGASISAHGFVGVIVAQAARHGGRHRVLAGNHRLKALVAAGAEAAPVMLVELSDQQALQFMLADNKAGRAAVTDEARLAEVLAQLFSEDALEPSGFTVEEFDELGERLGLNASVNDLPPLAGPATPEPVTAVRMTLTFARERVTPEVEAAVKDLALLYGGRYAVRGLAHHEEDNHEPES